MPASEPPLDPPGDPEPAAPPAKPAASTAESLPPVRWHHLFGLTLTDFFIGTPFVVELEKDLSFKRQMLDVVVLRKAPGRFRGQLPVGLEDLAEHNLLTYKSMREPLSDWSLDELIGHYVNYRKQVSGDWNHLLPVGQIRLYAISTRFPRKLARQARLDQKQPGVYDLQWGSRSVRILVLSEVPDADANTVWLLFSDVQKKVEAAVRRYRPKGSDASTVLYELFGYYRRRGWEMSYTMEDFKRDFIRRHRHELSTELLSQLAAEERLRGLPAEERLRGLPAEERLRGLPAEERLRGLPAEERLRGLPVDVIKAYLKELEERKDGGDG